MSDERINQSIREIEFIRSELIKAGETVKQLREENARLAAPAQESNRLMSENARLEEENQRLKEALKAQDEYISLLEKETNDMSSIAHVHGWRSKRYAEGIDAREKIENARKLIEP